MYVIWKLQVSLYLPCCQAATSSLAQTKETGPFCLLAESLARPAQPFIRWGAVNEFTTHSIDQQSGTGVNMVYIITTCRIYGFCVALIFSVHAHKLLEDR